MLLRVQRSIMRRVFGLLLFSHLLFSEELLIGTGSQNGIYYPTGQNICKVINKTKKQIECNATATKGSVYNIKGLQKGEFQFAIAQSDTIFAAYNGLGSFNGKAYKSLRTVMTIYPELFTFIVRKDAQIRKIHDIKGRVISIGAKGSGTRDSVEMLFAAAKPLSKKILKEVKELNSKESAAALKEGLIDGYFSVIGHPNREIEELAKSIEIDIIEISPKSCLAVKNILIKNPFFTISKIPANSYRGIDRDVASFGVKATLVTTADSSYESVYRVVKAIMENFELFKKMHPAYKNIKKRDVVKGLGAPLHPAAQEYFRKHGIL